MKNQAYAERTAEKMKEVLMNPTAPGPDVHYHMIRGGSEKKNITVWEPGTVGGEYIKAYGHYHITDFIETYRVIEGVGILLLQMRKRDTEGKFIDDEISSFEAISVKAGDVLVIPAFAGHAMINTGKGWLVTSDDSPVHFDNGDSASMPQHADYEPFRKMHGFAYYAIEKEGKAEYIRNPNYKTVPEVTRRTTI